MYHVLYDSDKKVLRIPVFFLLCLYFFVFCFLLFPFLSLFSLFFLMTREKIGQKPRERKREREKRGRKKRMGAKFS